MSDPCVYYQRYVLPSLIRWRNEDCELDLAMSVVTNLNNLAEHFFQSFVAGHQRVYGATNVKQFRKEIAERHPDLALIRDICDAHKHAKLDRATAMLTTSDQIDVTSLGFGEARFGEGRWSSPREVVVRLDNGSLRHFRPIVERANQVWRKLLLLDPQTDA